MGRGGEFWKKCGSLEKEMANHFNILALRIHEQCEKAERYDTERWTPQIGRCPHATGEEQRNNSRKTEAAAAAKSIQLCPTLCDPIDGSLPGSSILGILQARTLEWVAISFSSAWKWKVKVRLLSRVQLFATPWTAAHQAPPSMGFSRQEYWRDWDKVDSAPSCGCVWWWK